MMEQFGLRIRESVLIKPKYSDSGTNLAIEEGTKGKRTRNVPILTGQQRIVLDRAAAIAKMTKNGNLIPSGKTETLMATLNSSTFGQSNSSRQDR
jgi:hypothetical protein